MVRHTHMSRGFRVQRPRIRSTQRSETISRQEATRLLDTQARRYLGMPGAEFKARYKSGEFEDIHDSKVVRVAALIPFAED